MSGMVPFSGMSAGSGSGPSNPMSNQLRRIGAFRQALAGRQTQMADYMAAADHAHANNKDLLTHASREERRNQTHGAKVKQGLFDGVVGAGADPSAPGRTRVKMDGLEVETIRPEPKSSKKSGVKKASSPKTATTPTSPTPNHSPLQPKFQSP